MEKYTEKDINPMSWQEFENLTDTLVTKLSNYFDASNPVHVISQLHRSGGIVGSIVAIKMGIVPLLPVQFKYFYNPTVIQQITSIPDILVSVPTDLNIVLAEGNTSSGSIAKHAANAIKEKYPNAKIYLATLTKVYGEVEELENIEKIFYGTMTNENFNASPEEVAKLKLRKGITIFPWENVRNELNDLNAIE